MDSQINFSVVVHGRICRICQGGLTIIWGGGLATRGIDTRLLGGFGGMLPRKKIFYLCNLVRFGSYFFIFKKSKNVIFIHK